MSLDGTTRVCRMAGRTPLDSFVSECHLKELNLVFIRPCIIVIVEEWKTNLMSFAVLFHVLCA